LADLLGIISTVNKISLTGGRLAPVRGMFAPVREEFAPTGGSLAPVRGMFAPVGGIKETVQKSILTIIIIN